MTTWEVSDRGQGHRQGRSRQEGQAQEGPEGVGFDSEPIFHELELGREWLFVKICVVCNRTEDKHDSPDVRHVFTPEGIAVDASQFGPKRSDRTRGGDDTRRHVPTTYGAAQMPFDPVLRQALVNKGIITPEDLDEASKQIQMFTQAVTGVEVRRRG